MTVNTSKDAKDAKGAKDARDTNQAPPADATKDTNKVQHAGVSLIVATVILLGSSPAFAQLTAVPFSSPPPEAVSPALRAQLSADALRVAVASATLEFWWVTTLPLTGGTPAWTHVPEGSLIGAVRVTGPFKEIRGKTIRPGVYTLRLGLQPQNGDHLGASQFREHLLLSPAGEDRDAKPLGHEGTVEISKLTIGASHPAALSIDPPASTAAPLSTHANELDHQGLTVEVGTAAGPLRFGLILIGVIEH